MNSSHNGSDARETGGNVPHEHRRRSVRVDDVESASAQAGVEPENTPNIVLRRDRHNLRRDAQPTEILHKGAILQAQHG